jgi:hypothetical protein
MDYTNLDEWRDAAMQSLEVEFDEQMQVWFAWDKDICVGSFNLENQKGELNS